MEVSGKYCPSCKEDCPIDDFGRDKSRKDGLRAYCRICLNNLSKRYSKEKQKYYKAKSLYHITKQEFIKLKAIRKCQICKSGIKGKSNHIDHDHKTGTTRGALCTKCNIGLGMFRDNPNLLLSAADYLNPEISVAIA